MQIVLPEELESEQTLKLEEGDIQIHPEYLSDQTMKIGMDVPEEKGADRTMYLTHRSAEEDADRTMMINFAKQDEAMDRTMLINLPHQEDDAERTMMIPTPDEDEGSDRTMLVNLPHEEEQEYEAKVQAPSESKTARYVKVLKSGASSVRDSSLPLSMSKADESRHQPMGDPRGRSSTPRMLSSPPVSTDEDEDAHPLWGWTHRVHPTRGWLLAILCFPLSGLAFANIAFGWMLPDHPGPLAIVGSENFSGNYVVPDLATGFLIWFMITMIAQMLFSGAGGRPPLLWTLKIMVYALIPFAIVRLSWMGLNIIQSGSESFFRGYREPWVQWVTPGLYTVTGLITAFLLAKAATSTHCQAQFKKAWLSFSVFPIMLLAVYLSLLQVRQWRFEQRVGPSWRRAEAAWADSKPGDALPLLEEVLSYPRILTTAQKARFYQMRGELRLQKGLVLKAREDFVRTVQLLPPSHPENRLARAANLLALGRVDMARVQLQIAEEMRPASGSVQRWLARLALGDFDPDLKNPARALDYARQAVQLEPNGPNRAVLERSESALRAL